MNSLLGELQRKPPQSSNSTNMQTTHSMQLKMPQS